MATASDRSGDVGLPNTSPSFLSDDEPCKHDILARGQQNQRANKLKLFWSMNSEIMREGQVFELENSRNLNGMIGLD